MKAREAHQFSDEELRQHLADARQELFNLRFQKATREIANFARVGQVRKDIARFQTILRERELGYADEAESGATAKE